MAFDQGHALVIGIGTYRHTPRLNVPITAQDALAVAEVLRDPAACAYPPERVALLSDARATRQGILDALDALAGHTMADDTVLVFYSGHGVFGGDGYYLTTHETELEGKQVKAGTGIRATELLAKLQAIPAKRAILIFNACHAGALSPGALGGVEDSLGHSLPDALSTALLGTGEGRVIITACREDQKSFFAPDATLTTFTQALTDGLRGRDIDSRRGYISVFDLYTYVYDMVATSVRRRWDEVQEPVLTVHQGIGAMAVALYPGEVAQGALGAQDRPATIRGAAHEVSPAESRQMLRQILDGAVSLAAGRDIVNVGGNQYSTQGVSVSSGVVYGPVTGTNTGTITSEYRLGSEQPARPGGSVSLRDVRRALREAIDVAAQRGDRSLTRDLDEIEQNLNAAIDAEDSHDTDRHARKLRQVTADLTSLARNRQELQALVALLQYYVADEG